MVMGSAIAAVTFVRGGGVGIVIYFCIVKLGEVVIETSKADPTTGECVVDPMVLDHVAVSPVLD